MYLERAKAFGLFAALSFLQYYLSCYSPLQQKQKVSCFCDNSGVITSLTTLQTTINVHPNNTTNDTWDIYLAIHKAAKRCQMLKFQYWHVEGHQDMDPNHHLTIKEQHNVDCDKLAKTFVHNHPLCSIYMATPEFAVAEAHLKDGQVICQQVLLAL